ncbi:MAG TPA: UPF0175 family protein [Candidatus Nanoarchaeia archaeon]|nr:UPF0175 family protein [Candidatus Nanoarchaeia archaeon]
MIIRLYQEGRISLREAARLCSVTLRDMLYALRDHGVSGNVSYDTQKRALEIIEAWK